MVLAVLLERQVIGRPHHPLDVARLDAFHAQAAIGEGHAVAQQAQFGHVTGQEMGFEENGFSLVVRGGHVHVPASRLVGKHP